MTRAHFIHSLILAPLAAMVGKKLPVVERCYNNDWFFYGSNEPLANTAVRMWIHTGIGSAYMSDGKQWVKIA